MSLISSSIWLGYCSRRVPPVRGGRRSMRLVHRTDTTTRSRGPCGLCGASAGGAPKPRLDPAVPSWSVTYDPGRREPGGRVPVLRDEWREPLRAQRDPLAEDSGGPGPTATSSSSGASRPGWAGSSPPTGGAPTRCRSWSSLTVRGALPDGHRHQHARAASTPRDPSRVRRPSARPSTAIVGAPPQGTDRSSTPICRPASCPTAGRSPRPAPRPGTSCRARRRRSARAPTKTFTYTVEVEDGIDTTAFGGDEALRADGQRDAGQPEELDAQPAVRVHPRSTTRPTPDFRVSLTSPMTVREGCGYDIPLEASCYNPAYGRTTSRGCSSTRPAGCAARSRSRATSAPTGST